MKIKETIVENINKYTSIIDIDEIKMIGVKVKFSPECRGNLTDYGTNNVRMAARKYIHNGTIQIIADLLHIKSPQYIGVRINNEGDGLYDFVIGIVVESFDNVPKYLPEYSTMITFSVHRYTRMNINEKNLSDRTGYGEQMEADEYFIGGFRL